MTPREIVTNALKREPAGTIPYNVELTSRFAAALRERTGCADPDAFLGNQLYREKYKKNRRLEGGRELDLFGVTWSQDPAQGDVGIVSGYPLREPSLAGYTFPEVDRELAHSLCRRLEEDPRHRYRMFSITMSYFERAWSLRGMDRLLIDMALNPAFVEELLERILAHHLELLDAVLDRGFEGVYIGDDWGQQQGLIMGPPCWRRFIKPGMRRLFDRIKAGGKTVCLHSCGDLREILPELVDMGLDIYNTIQPEIYDLEALKREYGRHLAFYGGISTQQFLPYASPDQVRALTREVMGIMGEGGGYILGPTHAVTADIPVDNVLAMVETAAGSGA